MRLLRPFACLVLLITLSACGEDGSGSEGNPADSATVTTLPSSTLVSTITSVPSSTIAPSITSQPSATAVPTFVSQPSASLEPVPTATEVMLLAATLTPQPEVPASDAATDRVEALIAQLEAEGSEVTRDDIVIEADFARVTRQLDGETLFVFYKWEAGAWNRLAAGGFFDPESAARLGIPETLLP